MRALIALVLLAGSSAIAQPTPARKELDTGIISFKSRDYQSAYRVINSLLYPPPPQFTRREDEVEAHVVLGAALFHLGNHKRAVEEFRAALQLDIERTITNLMYEEEVIKLFDDVKAKLKAELELDRVRREQAERDKRIREYLETIGVYETHSFGYNFIPFGGGQFQNGHRTKGALLAGAQVATLVTSVGIWLYLAAEYGLSAKVPLEDGPGIRRLQQIEVGTGLAFFALYAYGVVDGMLYYKPNKRVKGDDSLLPPELRDPSKFPAKPKPRTSFRDRLRIGPILTPNGAGIGIGWETD